MKYSRMEKYHGENKDKEKHYPDISDEELNKNLEDLSRHSKKVNKFINASKFIGIIAIAMIILTYILYVISGDTSNKNNSSQNEPKQTEVTKSSKNKSNYNESIDDDTNADSENRMSDATNSNQNEFSNNQTQDSQNNQNLQQANNHMFSSLEEAKEYGISCVNKGICSNYSVQNIGNGMYQVILE